MDAQLFDRTGNARDANTTTGKTNAPARQYVGHCGRCGGSGHYSFNLMDGTRCYGCNGSGRGSLQIDRLYTREQLDKLIARAQAKIARAQAKAEAERLAIEAERAARRTEFLAANATVLGLLDELIAYDAERDIAQPWRVEKRERNGERPFWLGFKDDAVLRANPLSDAQVDAVHRGHTRMLADRVARKAAHHVGEIGKRLRGVKATVTTVKHISTISRFPLIERWLVKFKTDDGADLTWWTGHPVDEGACTIDFTVKEHDAYQGTPQTIVQRVAFKD